MSRSCDSSTPQCWGIAPTHKPCEAPDHERAFSDCGSYRPPEPSPAATQVSEPVAEAIPQSESAARNYSSFQYYQVGSDTAKSQSDEGPEPRSGGLRVSHQQLSNDFGPCEHCSGLRRHGIVVAHESLRFHCFVRLKVVGPPEADRLI